MPIISDKSSIGFQRPKSLVVVCWPVRCFLAFFELAMDLTARRFSGAEKWIFYKIFFYFSQIHCNRQNFCQKLQCNRKKQLPGDGDATATGCTDGTSGCVGAACGIIGAGLMIGFGLTTTGCVGATVIFGLTTGSVLIGGSRMNGSTTVATSTGLVRTTAAGSMTVATSTGLVRVVAGVCVDVTGDCGCVAATDCLRERPIRFICDETAMLY